MNISYITREWYYNLNPALQNYFYNINKDLKYYDNYFLISNITKLYIDINIITKDFSTAGFNLDDLKYCTHVTELHIVCKETMNISFEFIKNLINLEELYIHDCKTISDISFLTFNTKLKFLGIKNCSFNSLRGIENVFNLKKLIVIGCFINNLDYIHYCTNLEMISLQENTLLYDINNIFNLNNLDLIELIDLPVVNVRNNNKYFKLNKILIMDNKYLKNLKFLRTAFELSYVHIKNNSSINSLEGLENCLNISDLYYVNRKQSIDFVSSDYIKIRDYIRLKSSLILDYITNKNFCTIINDDGYLLLSIYRHNNTKISTYKVYKLKYKIELLKIINYKIQVLINKTVIKNPYKAIIWFTILIILEMLIWS